MNKRWATVFVVGCLAVLNGCSGSSSDPVGGSAAANPPVTVSLVRPHRGNIARSVTLPAAVLPYQQALLCAKVAGYLKQIAVDKGDHVREGDLLAEIEVPELLADQVRFKAEVVVAELEFKRVREAQAKAPDLVVPQSVDNAQARLEVAQANLERNKTLLAYARITAPFSGVITRRFVDAGAFIPAATSGSAERAALLNLMDFGTVRVQVAIPEIEVPHVTNGLPARVHVEELRGRVFEGHVTRFAHALDEATKTMLAEIELPNADGTLRPGMYASLQLAVEQKADAILIPADALMVEKVRTSVFTVSGKQAKKVVVRTGFNDGTSVEILDGLKGDEPVVLLGKQTLNDGQEVAVKEVK